VTAGGQKITPPPPTVPALQELYRPGDVVEIDWAAGGIREENERDYGNVGEIVKVLPRFLEVRHRLGFTFSVSRSHIISGVRVRVVQRDGPALQEQRKGDDQMRADGDSAPVPPAVTEAGDLGLAPRQTEAAFEVPAGQDWREVLTAETYRELKAAGWSDLRIMNVCGITKRQDLFYAWKRKQKLIGVSLRPGKTPAGDSGPDSRQERLDHTLATCGSGCGSGCRCADPGLTDDEDMPEGYGEKLVSVADVIKLIDAFEADKECCRRMLQNETITDRVAEVLLNYLTQSESRIEILKNAKLVL
jgi:hypothetical protein